MKRFPVGEPGERWTEDWRGRLLSRWLATRYDGGITAARWNLKPGTGTETSVTRGGRIVGCTPKRAWGDEWLIDDGWRKERGERRTREENKRGWNEGEKHLPNPRVCGAFNFLGKRPCTPSTVTKRRRQRSILGWNPPQIQREREEWEGPSESIIRRIFLVARAWETNTAPANPHRVALASVVSLPTNAHVAVARSR